MAQQKKPAPRKPADVFGDPGPDTGLWWRRVAAYLLDGLFQMLLLLPALVVGIALMTTDSGGAIAIGLVIIIVAALAVSVLYAPVLMKREGEKNGQSWGKQIMKVRVIRDAKQTPYDFGSAFIRQFLVIQLLFGLASQLLAGLPWIADSLWPLFDKQNRALHDMVVDSRVIHAK